MLSASSLLALFQTAFAGWPWQLLPVGMASLAVVGGLAQMGLVWRRRQHRPHAPLVFDATPSSIQAALQDLRKRLELLSAEQPDNAIRIVEEVVQAAVVLGASDIHWSPLAKGLSITIRVHGGLHTVASLPQDAAEHVTNRLKVLARLDLHVRKVPQDGRLTLTVNGRTIEARISTLPTEGGERIVLRLIEGARSVPGLQTLGFSGEIEHGLAQLLSRPQGLFFVTGPVGSGKSTTLYATLSHIHQTRGETTTMVTLEDPIELRLPFAAQTQINPRTKMTFASGLRSALRQDPNVLMVGEIRDRETADIAMQASLTGHLLLTTVHADDATGPFARMIDMGIEPFLLASSVAGSLSQRLVRTLCPVCRRRAKVDAGTIERFRGLGITLETDDEFFESVGCDACDQLGFVGRAPVGELLLVDGHVRAELHEGCPSDVMRQRAIARGMTPLVADGVRLARAGETTLHEVLRVAG